MPTPDELLLDAMRNAVERAQASPADVAAEAAATLDRLGAGDVGTELEAMAAWARGLAAREQNDLDLASTSMERGIGAAVAAGLPSLAGRIQVSWSLVLAYLGRPDEAMRVIDATSAVLSGPDLARATMQRGLLLQRAGELRDALDAYSDALPGLVDAGDTVAEIRLRINRGVAATYLHDYDAGSADLVEARRRAMEIGQDLQATWCAHNLGFLHGRQGSLVQSLEWFDRAIAAYASLDVDASTGAVIYVDRAEVLAGVGLVEEAMGDVSRARDRLAETDNRVELAEADLLLARIALAAGSHELAHVAAGTAEEAFRDGGRARWAALARALAVRSRHDVVSAGDAAGLLSTSHDRRPRVPARPAVDAARAAADLEAADWRLDARSMAVLAGRLHLARGDVPAALALLEPVAATRRSGSAVRRVEGWESEALIRIAADDRSGARRAIRAGLDTISAFRTTMAATDLRATVSSIGDRLASWLVELALDGGGARDVWRAAEAWRAGALVAPVAPPADAELERLLGELRATDADLRAGVAGADDRRARLETSVRDRSRQIPAAARSGTAGRFDPAELADALGDRVLVEFVEHRGVLHAVSVVDGRASLHHLGAVEALEPEVRSLSSCLQRLARATGSQRSLASARDTLAVAARRVTDALFGPIRAVGRRSAVVVPTGILYEIPWAALPRLADAPFVVAPSSTVWMAAQRAGERTTTTRGLVAAAGPDLAGAVEEVDEICRARDDARRLVGADADVASVLAAVSGVRVAHFAAHGDFRSDNPQLCSLRMADGELRVYDLERVDAVPPVVVLSACDAGAVDVRSGDELLGFAAAVLGSGASSMIAPVVAVDDEATVEILVSLHRRLAAGDAPGDALHHACRSGGDDGGAEGARRFAAQRSFVVFGS